MKIKGESRGAGRPHSYEVLGEPQVERFIYDPKVEFSPEDRQRLIKEIEKIFSYRPVSNLPLKTAWMFDRQFPDELDSPIVRSEIRKLITQQSRIFNRDCLDPDRSRDEAYDYFVALAGARKFLPDLSQFWPAGKVDQRAILVGEDTLLKWTKDNALITFVTKAKFLMSAFPELRAGVVRAVKEPGLSGEAEPILEQLAAGSQNRITDTYTLDQQIFYRMLMAFEHSGTFPPLTIQQVRNAKQVMAFEKASHLRSSSFSDLIHSSYNLQLGVADQLEFPDDGPVRPVRTVSLGKSKLLPARLEL